MSWNPISGCSKVSPGCKNCYAERLAKGRLRGRFGYPKDDPFRVTLHPDKLEEPLHWRKPRMVFVCSMGDLFHEDVPNEFIAEVFQTMTGECSYRAAPEHTYQILTKRPQRAVEFFKWLHLTDHDEAWLCALQGFYKDQIPSYVWVGVSVEDPNYLTRIYDLTLIPAAVRFLSCEPLLSPLDFTDGPEGPESTMGEWSLLEYVDWVIVGGETGPGARPMDPQWARDIRDQCKAAGVPFFMKNMSGREPIPKDLMVREFPQ
jgi:protein gp37